MDRSTLSSRLGRSTAFVGVLLVGALVLAGLLAYQAFDANRSHAAAVRKTLNEQAQFAAWEYANNLRRMLDGKVLYLGLDVVAACGGKVARAPIDLRSLRAVARSWEWAAAEHVTTYFRIDLDTGHVVLAGSETGPDIGAWLLTEVRRDFASHTAPGWQPMLLEVPDEGGYVAYRFFPEDRRDAEVLYGFRIEPEGLDVQFLHAVASSPLLPEGLTGGRPNDQLFAVSMENRHGRPVWTSGSRYTSAYEARDTLGARYAGLTARVVVNPDLAPSLVIGGLPRSRMPFIMILFLLTAGLVAGAFFQLRRETELAQLRADFVSGVSHELRTPLAQIRMFGETLLLGRVRNEEERRRSLEIIVNESHRLTHQVGNVLLYSRSERHGTRAELEDLDLSALAAEVVESFRPLAAAAGHEVRMDPDGEPVRGTADPKLIRQALLNLLDNAVKYGPAGQTVRVGTGQDRDIMRIWVVDEGSGVPARDRERIWQPYFRMEQHRESSVAGSGIGLSVVRQVADVHRGRALVETTRQGGARFVLEVPRRASARADRAHAPRTATAGGSRLAHAVGWLFRAREGSRASGEWGEG